MSMFDGILDNIDDMAAKLGLPADQVQAVVANLKDKMSAGGNPVEALSVVAQEHGLSMESLKSVLPDGGEGLLAKAQSMLDRDGDGNPLNDLGGTAKGLFGSN